MGKILASGEANCRMMRFQHVSSIPTAVRRVACSCTPRPPPLSRPTLKFISRSQKSSVADGSSSSSSGIGSSSSSSSGSSSSSSSHKATGTVSALLDRSPVTDKHGTPFSVRSRAILPMRIVESAFVRWARPIVGNVAYIGLASGFLMTDILALRTLLVGGYTLLVTFHLLHANPLRIPLRWSAFFVCVNFGMAVLIARERSPSGLTEQDEVLRSAFFDRLTPGDFVRLLALGERRELADGTTITVQGKHCENLIFVERGIATLAVDGKHVANLERGGFINDVAFQQGAGAGAYGTVVATGRLNVIAWEQSTLRQVLEKCSSTALLSIPHHVRVHRLPSGKCLRSIRTDACMPVLTTAPFLPTGA